MSAILDIITVVLFIGIILSSVSRGFVRSVVELIGIIVSFLVASALSIPFGNWIYLHFIKAPLTSGASSYIASLSGSAEQSFRQFLANYHLSADFLSSTAGSAGSAGNSALVSGLVDPMGNLIGRGIAFILLFLVCMFAVHLIARVGDVVNKLPLIGGLNRLLGALIGVVKAVLVMFLVCTLVEILIPVFAVQKNPPITNTTIESTYVFQYFYHINPVKDILLIK